MDLPRIVSLCVRAANFDFPSTHAAVPTPRQWPRFCERRTSGCCSLTTLVCESCDLQGLTTDVGYLHLSEISSHNPQAKLVIILFIARCTETFINIIVCLRALRSVVRYAVVLLAYFIA